MSAGFHRLRRAHFKRKNANEPSTKIETMEEPERISGKGRRPKAVKTYPRQTSDEWVAAERKRIFIKEIQRRAGRNKADG